MTSGRTGCGAYPNARCFTYSLTLKPHFLASTAILLFSWSVTRNAIRFSFFINQLLVSSLFGGLGNAPKISPVSGLEGNLWHTSSLLVTLQDSLSPPQIDMFASYRSFKGQSQVCASWNIRKAQIIRLRDVPERFFCRLCVFSFLTAFSARSAAVFSNFAVANHQMRRHIVLRHSHIDGVSPKKRRHFVIPCRRKHSKTPAFAQRFPATAGTAPKQAEKELYFPTLSVPPEPLSGICP